MMTRKKMSTQIASPTRSPNPLQMGGVPHPTREVRVGPKEKGNSQDLCTVTMQLKQIMGMTTVMTLKTRMTTNQNERHHERHAPAAERGPQVEMQEM